MSVANPRTQPRPLCRLPHPSLPPNSGPHPTLHARDNQILVWIALAQRPAGQPAVVNDQCFPVIFDPGCDSTLVISQWHLEHWAKSKSFDPMQCRVLGFVDETVANSPPVFGVSPSGPPGGTKRLPAELDRLIGQSLGVVMQDLGFAGHQGLWLPKIEADIWLTRNQPGERDYAVTRPPKDLLQVGAIICRPGISARPPLLGTQAFTQGFLIEFQRHSGKGQRFPRKPKLEVDYNRCTMRLDYA